MLITILLDFAGLYAAISAGKKFKLNKAVRIRQLKVKSVAKKGNKIKEKRILLYMESS